MPRNIEIKARMPDAARFDAVARRAQALASGPIECLEQDDRFYASTHGRLKLRVFADGSGELIAYRRPDRAGPRPSTYERVPVPDPQALHEALAAACGFVGHVRKRRRVVLTGRTRIHLDEVEQLGRFVELEVVLRDGEPECDGLEEAEALMTRLEIRPQWLVEGAYLDLLASGAGRAR